MSEPKRRRGVDLTQVRTGSKNERPLRIQEKVDMLELPADKVVNLRIISPIYMYAGYWVKTQRADGSATSFYVPSRSYDPTTQTFDSTIEDPFYEEYKRQQPLDREDQLISVRAYGYCLVIDRSEEKRIPRNLPKPTNNERKTGFKEKDSDSFTPVKVLRLSASMIEQLQDLTEDNTVTHPKTREIRAMSVAHPRFGIDIRLKYSPKRTPAQQYKIMAGKRTPLTEEQQAYLKWDLDDLETPETLEELERSFNSWAERMGLVDEPKGRKSKGRNNRRDDFDDDDDGFDDDDDGLDDAPKRRGKPAHKSKGRKDSDFDDDFDDSFDDDDEDDDSFDDEDDDFDDDFDDEPKRKPSKSKAKPSKKSRRDDFDDESEDDDSFEDDDDDFDDFGEDDSDDWDDDDEDDEDDEPEPRKTKGRKSSPAKSSSQGKKTKRNDDDFDDDDDGLDDAPARRTKSKAKPSKKSRQDDFDDEDDWEDDIPF